jgi:glutathione S-transferase
MIKIYGLFTPNFLKPIYLAEELGMKYEIIPVNLIKGETRTPEHFARHPFGKVPCIEHNGEFLFESNAIIRYMASLSTNAVFPAEPLARAKVDQWVEYFSHQAGRWCTSVWFQKVIGPKAFNQPPDEKMVKDSSEWLLEVMPKIDLHLSKNTYLTGNQFTLADLVAHTGMMGYKDAGLNFGDFKNFTRWFDLVESRPSYKRATEINNKLSAEAMKK